MVYLGSSKCLFIQPYFQKMQCNVILECKLAKNVFYDLRLHFMILAAVYMNFCSHFGRVAVNLAVLQKVSLQKVSITEGIDTFCGETFCSKVVNLIGWLPRTFWRNKHSSISLLFSGATRTVSASLWRAGPGSWAHISSTNSWWTVMRQDDIIFPEMCMHV